MLKSVKNLYENLRCKNITLDDIPQGVLEETADIVFRGNVEDFGIVSQGFKNLYHLEQSHMREQGSILEVLIGFYELAAKVNQSETHAAGKFDNAIDIAEKCLKNELTDEFIDEYTWGDVAALRNENGRVELFWKVCEKIRNKNIERIRNKDKIKIAFFTKDSAEWSTDALYRMLQEDGRYEVYVLVAPFIFGTAKTVVDTYEKAVEYFENKGYTVYGMAECENDDIRRIKTWEELPVPDVMFMLNPHVSALKGSCNVENFPLKTLITYVPYGFAVYGEIHDQYNQISHALCWKIFYESESDMEICRRHSDLGDRNALMSGYLKMDGFYDKEMPDTDKIWKIPEGKTNVKKIIYAPHWSIRGAVTGFGNFDKIYDWIYEYAKNHADTTSWIFRPHPMLRAGVVDYGVFETENDFDNYMKKWDELPNARVVERGEYIDIFRTSDAMVLDSISFLAEYQYTNKPLLLLTREANTWNEFGEKLLKILYSAPGEDTGAIERFIDDVVIKGNDPMKQERQAFFDKYLDYRTRNGKLACEYVKDFLDETFENEKE
jgi:hypothetical protein